MNISSVSADTGVYKNILTYIIYIRKHILTDRQADSQPGRQPCSQAGRQAGRQTDRRAGRQSGRQAGTQAGRQTNKGMRPWDLDVGK